VRRTEARRTTSVPKWQERLLADRRHVGPSDLIAFGSFAGGELFLENDDGPFEMTWRRC
jgi:hypothetical protein